MDAWQVAGIAIGVIVMLVGAVYAWLVWNQQRLGKNLHKVRSILQTIIITLASKGIIVRVDNKDE